MTILGLVAIGLVAGVVSALCGIGGGVIVVPALLWLKGFDPRLAVGTSLAYILPTALAGVLKKMPAAQVDWEVALIAGAGGIVGAVLGDVLLQQLPVPWVKRIFAVLLAAMSAKLLLEA
jgi:uncharacterized membrane protein YfcA